MPATQPRKSTSQTRHAQTRRDRLSATPERGLLKEQAYTAIKARILRGDLGQNAFLAERQLADQMGMSKTPVRAALERLQAEGFVTIAPQQGVLVRNASIHEIADQYEIRVALETYVLRAVAGRLTPAQLTHLKANLAAQEQLGAVPNPERSVELDAEFHNLFCVFLGNHEIIRVMGHLRDKMQRTIRRVIEISPNRMVNSLMEHRAIARAVIDGDATNAARLITEHLEYGKQCLLSPR